MFKTICIVIVASTITLLCTKLRHKYEVFAHIITTGRYAKPVNTKRFRSYKKAIEHYAACKEKYGLAGMREI